MTQIPYLEAQRTKALLYAQKERCNASRSRRRAKVMEELADAISKHLDELRSIDAPKQPGDPDDRPPVREVTPENIDDLYSNP